MDSTAGAVAAGTKGGEVAGYDVVVVGGGAAGLAGAVALARSRRSVLVVDAGAPRNAPAGHVHNYLGREGSPPGELLAVGREELAGYGGEVVADRVTAVERQADGTFLVARAEGPVVRARRLLVTTGVVDELPDVARLAERWGRDVLHCPFCHGWEVRDEPIAILASSPMYAHSVGMWRQLSAEVTVVLHDVDPPSAEQAVRFAALGIEVVAGPAAAAVEVVGDRIAGIRLVDGRVVGCRQVVVQTRFAARAEVLVDLGLEVAEFRMGDLVLGTHVPADPMGATDVAGVWVAGNVANPMAQVITSAGQGLMAGAAINADLVEEDGRLAVAASR